MILGNIFGGIPVAFVLAPATEEHLEKIHKTKTLGVITERTPSTSLMEMQNFLNDFVKHLTMLKTAAFKTSE